MAYSYIAKFATSKLIKKLGKKLTGKALKSSRRNIAKAIKASARKRGGGFIKKRALKRSRKYALKGAYLTMKRSRIAKRSVRRAFKLSRKRDYAKIQNAFDKNILAGRTLTRATMESRMKNPSLMARAVGLDKSYLSKFKVADAAYAKSNSRFLKSASKVTRLTSKLSAIKVADTRLANKISSAVNKSSFAKDKAIKYAKISGNSAGLSKAFDLNKARGEEAGTYFWGTIGTLLVGTSGLKAVGEYKKAKNKTLKTSVAPILTDEQARKLFLNIRTRKKT